MASASPPRPPERPASCHANMIMSAIVVLVVALKCVDSLSTDPVILQTGDSVDNPLHAACTRGNFMAVWRLIEGGADIDSTSDDGTGTTGLMLASGFGHVKVVQLLLDRRANVNKVDEEGVTPLMRAAQEGHVPVVKLLLQHGADTEIKNKSGWTASEAASKAGQREVMAAFAQHKPYVYE